MRVLGINCNHDASLAIAENGRIIFAAEEERLTGFKKTPGFPARTLLMACQELGCDLGDFDKVVYSQEANFFFRPTIPWKGLNHSPYKEASFINHHYAHAVSAYCWSGFDDCMVLTLDGGGDGLFATIWEGKDGKLTLRSQNPLDRYPFGLFYNQVTEVCGFKPNRHEGKVMGLAAHGKANGLFDALFWVDGSQIHSVGHMTGKYDVEPLVRNRVASVHSEIGTLAVQDVAASAQRTFEEVIIEWIAKNVPRDANLAVAGGAFANVLANMKIAGMVKRFFVAPPMFDDGLAIGAALSAFDPLPSERPRDLYLGFTSPVNDANRYSAGVVAQAIESGFVVGLCQGAMEFGPRALGNRSILADPRDEAINQNLNRRLRRSEFMPFAPVILEEYAPDILEDYATGLDNAPFMTSCWRVKDEWKLRIPAVVHLDGTARPQVLKRETNPFYYDIIDEFRKNTGIPALINTSFNGHESPIVCFREEAEWMRDLGQVDVLVEGRL